MPNKEESSKGNWPIPTLHHCKWCFNKIGEPIHVRYPDKKSIYKTERRLYPLGIFHTYDMYYCCGECHTQWNCNTDRKRKYKALKISAKSFYENGMLAPNNVNVFKEDYTTSVYFYGKQIPMLEDSTISLTPLVLSISLTEPNIYSYINLRHYLSRNFPLNMDLDDFMETFSIDRFIKP